MSENEEKSKFEELSAWLDNEDTSITEDQINSAENKEAAADFKKIDAAISSVSAAPTAPADMVAKIAAKCNEKEPIQFSRHIIRIAAIAAACLAITFMYKDQEPQTDTKAEVTKTDESPKAQPVMNSLDDEKKLEALRANPEPATSDKFDLVTNNPDRAKVSGIALGSEVKHVWVSEDPERTALELQKLAGIVSSVNSQADAKGNIKLTLTIADTDLVKIVNTLNKAGIALVSKELPQPNQPSAITTSGKMIKYNVSILRKN